MNAASSMERRGLDDLIDIIVEDVAGMIAKSQQINAKKVFDELESESESEFKKLSYKNVATRLTKSKKQRTKSKEKRQDAHEQQAIWSAIKYYKCLFRSVLNRFRDCRQSIKDGFEEKLFFILSEVEDFFLFTCCLLFGQINFNNY